MPRSTEPTKGLPPRGVTATSALATQPFVVPLPLPGATVQIPLSQGQVAVIDASDYPLVAPFRWRALQDDSRCYAVTWTRGADGRQTLLLLHRLLLQPPPGLEVDHRNGDGLDNRRCNLRPATHSQNIANSRKARNNTSGYKGVYWAKNTGKWCAQGRHGGRQQHLGSYSDPVQAARVYDAWARQAHGEFAALNFPDEVWNLEVIQNKRTGPRTHCKRGHELTSENVYLARQGRQRGGAVYRACRLCRNAALERYYERQRRTSGATQEVQP